MSGHFSHLVTAAVNEIRAARKRNSEFVLGDATEAAVRGITRHLVDLANDAPLNLSAISGSPEAKANASDYERMRVQRKYDELLEAVGAACYHGTDANRDGWIAIRTEDFLALSKLSTPKAD